MKRQQTLSAFVSAALCLSLAASALAAPRKPAPRKPAPRRPAAPGTLAPMPVAPASATPTSSATPAPGDVVLYNGEDASQGLKLAAWGGGSIEDSTDISFAKGHALKVTTLDPYQGARITFNTPVDLGADKSRMFQITLRLTKADRTFPPPPASTQNNGFGGNGFGNQENGGGFGPQFTPNQTVSGLTTLKSVHLLFTLANGQQADVIRPYPDVDAGTEQWVNLAVPVAALSFPSGAGSPLQSVSVGGDDFAVFYVGQIKLVQDTTPITCFAGDRQDVFPRQPVTLHGTASGGASALRYSWDFDDKDGITDQAEGPSVTTQYLKSGTYKVTLTVSDIDGLKKPATSTTVIHVGQ